MLLKYKIITSILLAITLVFLVKDLFSTNSLVFLHVRPTAQHLQNNIPLEKYGNQSIYLEGKMETRDLNFWQALLVPQEGSANIIQYLFIILYLTSILVQLFKFNLQRLFANEVSNKIKLLGYGFLAYGIIDIFRSDYLNTVVKKLTNNNFELNQKSDSIFIISAMSLLLIIGKLFERGREIQLENDLTV